VFLRELISNASDALDKIRFLALSAADLLGDTKDLEIKISFDEEAKTLSIRDTGLGMTKADLIANLGTVAKSGTTNFVEAMAKGQDIGMIGQFGVGFYSVYLVADRVRVTSKNNADEQYVWESTAESSFTVAKDPSGNTLGRGTEITMFLKEDALDFLKQDKLKELIQHYSEFITFPISLRTRKEEVVEIDNEEDDEPTVGEDGLEIEEEKQPAAKKTEKVVSWDWERVNGNVAIWSRDKEEITDEEYQAFFKAVNTLKGASGDARTWIHFKAEGEIEFKSILFIPSEAGRLYEEYQTMQPRIKLYVRKVLIQSEFEQLLPKYLNFVVGVVDSDDLPLNVSRETLQQHKLLKVMGKKLVRKVLEMLKKLAGSNTKDEDPEVSSSDSEEKVVAYDPEHPYIKFWEEFGKSIKMGAIEDKSNRPKLAKLLRFKSSTSEDRWVSLDEYTKSMQPWQTDVYYIAGETDDAVRKSPFLEVAQRKGVQVLYLTDPLDEYVFQHMTEYEGHKVLSLTKEGVKFGDEDEATEKRRSLAYKKKFEALTGYMKALFNSKVGKVSVSARVEKSPAVIVTSQWGYTANMERIMRAQTMGGAQNSAGSMASSRTLELNPRHPIVVKLSEQVMSKPEDQNTKDLAFLVYDTALLASGFAQEETDSFAERMYRVIAGGLKVDSLELLPEIDPEEEEEEEESPSFPDADDDDDDADDEL
jgi:heat shock protein beta